MQTTTTLTRSDIERLPNFKKKTAKEFSSACPFCNAGKDRFLFWPDKGNYLCRQCGAKGFVDAPGHLSFTPEQYEAWKRAEAERQRQEREQQLTALDAMAKNANAERYHRNMLDRSYWYGQGLTDATINRYKLGYCTACPTYLSSPSHTIPLYYHGRLINIRHRLARPEQPGDKYRPEMAGLPAAIFNADLLDAPEWMTVIVEGEVKAMVMNQAGFWTVGIPGANTFKEKWVRLFANCPRVYIALDPGADEQAQRIGRMIANAGIDTRICKFPVKPDDMIVRYRASASDIFRYLVLGRPIKVDGNG